MNGSEGKVRHERHHVKIASEFGLNILAEYLQHPLLHWSRTMKQVLLVQVDGVMSKLVYDDDVHILIGDIRNKIKDYKEVEVFVYLETP